MKVHTEQSRGERVAYGLTGFTSFGEYAHEFVRVPKLVLTRAFYRRGVVELDEARIHEGGKEMKKVLGPLDLICFGIGMMLGAGVFVTTGQVSADMAGPAVILSYAVAGLSAFFSAFCYAEFAVDMPFAGGAYTYITASMGEFLGWITVANLIFEYILSGAAAIRGFSPYFAALCGKKPADFFTTEWNGYTLDWWALGICLALTVLLVLGTKESSNFNLWTTILHVALVLFIIIAGFTQANGSNAKPFFLEPTGDGVRGMFNGASIVFFSYIGFDAVATANEEVKNVARDMPIGIIGALGITTSLYILMSAVLVTMVPNEALQTGASFAFAFDYVGLPWAGYIVSAGAVMGIITTTLVGMYGVSRIITTVARDHLLPPYLARVHPRLQTPYIAIIIQGVTTALIALFTDFASILDMVSISTLFAFWLVAVGLLWRRGYVHGHTRAPQTILLVVHLAVIVAASLALSIYYQLSNGWIGLLVPGAVLVAAAISYAILVKNEYLPERYKVPLFPFLPIASVGLNTFLLGQLPKLSYERFGIWTAACIGIYLLYGMPSSALRDEKRNRLPGAMNLTPPSNAHLAKEAPMYKEPATVRG